MYLKILDPFCHVYYYLEYKMTPFSVLFVSLLMSHVQNFVHVSSIVSELQLTVSHLTSNKKNLYHQIVHEESVLCPKLVFGLTTPSYPITFWTNFSPGPSSCLSNFRVSTFVSSPYHCLPCYLSFTSTSINNTHSPFPVPLLLFTR